MKTKHLETKAFTLLCLWLASFAFAALTLEPGDALFLVGVIGLACVAALLAEVL